MKGSEIMYQRLITVGLLCMLCIAAVSISKKTEEDFVCHRPCCRENFISGLDPQVVLR